MLEETEQTTELSVERLTPIVVNGRRVKVPGVSISYEEVVRIAYGDTPFGDKTEFTVTYRRGKRPKPQGTLAPGTSVKLSSEMVFNVTPADKS